MKNKKVEEFDGHSVYEHLIAVLLDFKPVDVMMDIVHPDFMGYGSAAHEIFRTREDVKKMAEMQAQQLKGQGFKYTRTSRRERLFANGNICLILEEFQLYFSENGHELAVRVSTLLEKAGGKWMVVHFHGSSPDTDIAAEEAFPEQGLRKKNEELEAKIRERTRDLEIEAALERTRAQSLQMQHSSELNEVSKVFHEQLIALGIDSAFSFVWLPNEAAGDHLFWATWEEATETGSKIYTHAITYPLDKSEPYTAACFADWESGIPVHEHFVPPEDLDTFFASWEELLKGASKLKPKYFPEGIYYTEAFIKYGCFGIDTRKKLTKEEKSILHRFAKEFERTYSRFLDLQKAEAQAREAQIEAALERVRARTMAMQHSDELAEASHLLDEQVRVLGIKTWGCAFNIYRENDSIEWFGNEAGLLPTYTVPREGIFKEYYDAGQKGETLIVKEFSGEHCIAHYEYMSTLPVVGEVLRQLKETNGSFPDYQIDHVVYFKYGYLLFITRESVPEAHDIFRRFAGVFEQTYTRFLDLKKAEEQAREAQIELSLERIRAQVTAMQESSELLDIVVTMRTEFVKLGHEAHYFWHMRWLPEKYEKAMTSGDGSRIGMVMELPRHMHGDIKLLADWEKSQTATVVYAMNAEEAVAYVDKMVSLGDFQQIDPQAPSADDIRRIGGLTFVMARTTHGEIGFSLPGLVPEPQAEALETLVRFAGVFDLAYRRFEDLKKSERQKREAEIELALERVRARTMAMHQSEELEGVIKLIFEQFIALGLNVEHTGFILDYKTRDDMHIWLADQNAIVPEITFPYFDSPHWNSFLKARKSGESLFTNLLSFEEKNQFYKGLFEHLPEIPEEAQAHYFKVPGLAISTVLMDTVGLYIENFEAAPYSDHENEVLMRFGKVFQQSYTRFLDLKKAEAQAREAKIEAALERVRARTMAMQQSEELSDVAVVLFEQLQGLGGNYWGCGLGLCKKDATTDEFWFAYEKGILPPAAIPNTTDPAHKRMYQGWVKNSDFLAIEASGKELKEHYKYMMSLPEVRPFFQEILDKGLSFPEWQQWNAAYFKHGYLLVITLEPYSEPEILKRFAKVFEQTYTRFLDLQKAETQAREAKIEAALEKVRSRTMAMQRSDELPQVVATLYQQLVAAGIDSWMCVLALKNEKTAGVDMLLSNKMDTVLPKRFEVMPLDHRIWKEFYNGWEEGVSFKVIEYEGKEKREYEDLLINQEAFNDLSEDQKKMMRVADRACVSVYYMKEGMIQAVGEEKLPEEKNQILIRFAKAFEQTYTRFSDLKKAEAQAREAQIEAALEKVRSRTMAMQKGEELKEVAVLLYKELIALGVTNFVTCGYVEVNEEIKRQSTWVTSPGGDTMGLFYLPLTGDATFDQRYAAWKRQQPVFHQTVAGEVRNKHLEFAITTFNSKEAEEMVRNQFPDPTVFYCFNFSHGYLHLVCPSVLKEEEEVLLARFTRVFEQTYARFLDLKKAEAQAREAQIENALEKVRSRTMAMQRSDELPEAANILFLQVQELGIPAWSAGYCIWTSDDKKATSCNMSSEGELQKPFILPSIGEGYNFYDPAWEGKDFYVAELGGDALVKHYDFMSTLPSVGEILDELRAAGLSLPTFQIFHIVYFPHGFLMFITYEPVPEAHEIFKRFGKVFEQTYTRFLDLKRAEAQARESQIEAAMERIRSRAIAMRSSDELLDVAIEIRRQIDQLGQLDLEASVIHLYEKNKKHFKSLAAVRPPNDTGKIITIQAEFPVDATRGIRKMMDYYWSDQSEYTIEFTQKMADQWQEVLVKHAPQLGGRRQNFVAKGKKSGRKEYWNFADISGGSLLLVTHAPASEEAKDVMRRSADVLDLAYRRYQDLQKAEKQARQSRIETALERVRARALAMQEPEELMDVARVLRQEMGLLGVEELETSSIYIHDKNAEKTECWFAIKDIRNEEKVMASDHFSLNLRDTWVGRQMLKFFESPEEKVSVVMKGDQRKEWIGYCEKHSNALRGYYGEEIPERTYHLYKFSHGAIGAATQAGLSDESWNLLKRAASVFSLAYSRFRDLSQARLDLQRLKEEKKRAEDALRELQLTQQQLVHAEKMASLGELTAGIAHEIQNPLNFVNNFSEVSEELLEELLEELENGDLEESKALLQDIVQNLQKISHHGKRADGIVKGMLQHSRAGGDTKEPTDLNALADEYLRLAYHGLRAKDKSFNATIETDMDSTLKKIHIVPQDIGRVLLNLFTNAFHAVNERNQKKQEGYIPMVSLKTQKTKNGVEITVSDNGGGIPENIREKIFQPFFTTKPTGEGTGLGLSISYDIVTKGHGGSLRAESETGKTKFILILPA